MRRGLSAYLSLRAKTKTSDADRLLGRRDLDPRPSRTESPHEAIQQIVTLLAIETTIGGLKRAPVPGPPRNEALGWRSLRASRLASGLRIFAKARVAEEDSLRSEYWRPVHPGMPGITFSKFMYTEVPSNL